MIKYILLGFLNYQPLTGYELKQTIDDSTAHFWHAYHSQIYTTLRQMEEEGVVISEYVLEEGQPNRRIYSITAAGKQAIQDWLNQTLTEVTPIKEELLVRLFFSAQRDPQQVLTELRLQLELHLSRLQAYHAIAGQMAGDHGIAEVDLSRDRVFWQLTLDMGTRYEEAYIGWLQDSIQKIESL
jgi:DNA-binding PadR family transcriptional regulator